VQNKIVEGAGYPWSSSVEGDTTLSLRLSFQQKARSVGSLC